MQGPGVCQCWQMVSVLAVLPAGCWGGGVQALAPQGAVHLTGRLVSVLAPTPDTSGLVQEVVTLLGEGAVASMAADGWPGSVCDRWGWAGWPPEEVIPLC